MPNRGELTFPAQPDIATGDNAAWTFVCFCALGWLISVYVAVTAQPVEEISLLIAQSFW